MSLRQNTLHGPRTKQEIIVFFGGGHILSMLSYDVIHLGPLLTKFVYVYSDRGSYDMRPYDIMSYYLRAFFIEGGEPCSPWRHPENSVESM